MGDRTRAVFPPYRHAASGTDRFHRRGGSGNRPRDPAFHQFARHMETITDLRDRIAEPLHRLSSVVGEDDPGVVVDQDDARTVTIENGPRTTQRRSTEPPADSR